MPQKSKPPSRRVPSDDCKITVDGVDYFPHAGEWVDFRSRGSVEDTMLSLQLSQLQGAESDEILKHLSRGGTMEQVTEALAQNIRAWSWTDDDDNPLPNPPTARDVRSLAFDEIGYLIKAQSGGQQEGADDPVNASSDSTSS